MRIAPILFATLLSCAPVSSPEDLAAIHDGPACAARGGTIEIRGGLGPAPMCVIPYPDAGRACADSSQCAGLCLVAAADASARSGRTAAGHCQSENSRFGCYAEVRGGRAGPALCTD